MTTYELADLLLTADNIEVLLPIPGNETEAQAVNSFTFWGSEDRVPYKRVLVLEGKDKIRSPQR